MGLMVFIGPSNSTKFQQEKKTIATNDDYAAQNLNS